MKMEYIDGRVMAQVYVPNGELPTVLQWFEQKATNGTLTAILERGLLRIYQRKNDSTERPQDKSLTSAELARYKTTEYAWERV